LIRQILRDAKKKKKKKERRGDPLLSDSNGKANITQHEAWEIRT